jgi:hypothetical protein
MNHQQLNTDLYKEYDRYHFELQQLFGIEEKRTLSLPLLMHVFPEYDNLNKKLLIIGQETKGWHSTLADQSIDLSKILNHYKEFELAKTYRYRNAPFWRFSKALFKKLNPESAPNGLLWTNLSKVDQNGAGVNHVVRKKNKAGYELLLKELEIIKPEVVVFLTSHKNDESLKQTFKGLSIQPVEGIPDPYLVRLKHDTLPINSFRTYHPRFLNDGSRSKYSIDKMIELINIQSM